MIIETKTPQETFEVGKKIGENAKPGQIYTLTGIVKPVVFYKRRFVATWKRDKGTMLLDIFEDISQQVKKELEDYRQMYEEVLKQ